jgi:hypothetical protein
MGRWRLLVPIRLFEFQVSIRWLSDRARLTRPGCYSERTKESRSAGRIADSRPASPDLKDTMVSQVHEKDR